MRKVFQSSNKGKIVLLISACAVAAFILFRVLGNASQGAVATVPTPTPTPTPYPERTLPINLTQTIGGFTIELTAIEDTADGIEVKQSYQTNISEMNYLPVGSPEIRYSDGVTDSADGASLPAPGEDVDISLGSFIVADTGLSGVVDIPLSSRAENGDLSPQPELLVGSKRYAVTSLRFETFPWFEGMRVIVDTKPLNRAAEYGMLGVVAFSSAHATLTDGDGGVYDILFGSTEFAPFNQVVNGQSLMFKSAERKCFSSGDILTLNIRGAGNIVGPFVFENVHVVSESALVETPQVPGGPGAGEATTTPVSVMIPPRRPNRSPMATPANIGAKLGYARYPYDTAAGIPFVYPLVGLAALTA